mgnify:CR=1 FL=1
MTNFFLGQISIQNGQVTKDILVSKIKLISEVIERYLSKEDVQNFGILFSIKLFHFFLSIQIKAIQSRSEANQQRVKEKKFFRL